MAEAEVTELETDPAFHSALLRVCLAHHKLYQVVRVFSLALMLLER